MHCKKCGTENYGEAKFCGKCGAELEQDTYEYSKNRRLIVEKGKRLSIIVAIIIILELVFIAGYFVKEKREEEWVETQRIEKDAQDYKRYLSEAEKCMEESDYENAESLYLNAISIDPKKEEPYLKLADIYFIQEEYDKAEDILIQAESAVDEGKNGTEKVNRKSENSSEDEIDDSKTESEISRKRKEIVEGGKYTWVVEPEIEADDINYVTETDYHSYSRNGANIQFESQYAVIGIGDTMGLIDMDGSRKTELEYRQVFDYNNSYMLIGIEPVSYEGKSGNYLYRMNQDGEIVPSEELNCGESGECAFYWCEGLHHVDESFSWAKQVQLPHSAIPVQKSSAIFKGEGEDALAWWQALEGKYAIYSNKELITDFIYDECGSLSDGLFAVCKEGKWGYVDEKGEIIIPIEYDSSWGKKPVNVEDRSDATVFYFEETEEYCYAASGGYVPLCKDGKWELRDTQGKIVIRPDIFEAIRPVYEGKCWVKKDGKWGVIRL